MTDVKVAGNNCSGKIENSQERSLSRSTLEVCVLTLSNVFEVYKCFLHSRIIESVPLKHEAAI